VSELDSLVDFLAAQLANDETAWSVGCFGAIAEFMRDSDEAVTFRRAARSISAVTARGGLRIEARDGLRFFASESLTAQSWSHRVALCLPEKDCIMSRRTVLTEVGPDGDAVHEADRSAILFDLGLGALQLDAYVRVADEATARPDGFLAPIFTRRIRRETVLGIASLSATTATRRSKKSSPASAIRNCSTSNAESLKS